jgi:hypothetical protein
MQEGSLARPNTARQRALTRTPRDTPMLAFWLAVLPIFVRGDGVQAVPFAVFAPRDVTDSLVYRICTEASDIWESAGIVFACHRVRSEAESGDWPLEITIDDRRASEARDALGWITFTANRPDRSIHLSRACADDLVRTTPGLNDRTIASHETLIGRALGRALAHELGHYLLQSKAHTSRGLMRRIWSSVDSFAVSRTGFELTAEQRAVAVGSLARNERERATHRSSHVDQAWVGDPGPATPDRTMYLSRHQFIGTAGVLVAGTVARSRSVAE